ncbi:alpha/beta fold hydrolase [Salinisphaera japonica]|uniref:AB hydrolase-1 domain-containing protein n=1 Tax=Salinisphaera japonica YTM-1 TaxID=1209778 RepID=A0A423Q2Z0_9GAMM|nr:alpha/beta fold hydrolase [Salinisphaera japonica]ROO32913.1 hypothetical protein SAJA_00590 [Salinisphaera japonica YTM-1]
MIERPIAWLIVLLALGSASPAAADAALTWRACPEIEPAVSAATLRCATLRPGHAIAGQPVRLAVARLQARPDRISDHPVIFVPGGPGAPAGLDAAGLADWQRFQQYAGWPRDIVLFDPRSTGQSLPRVACNEGERLAPCRRRLGAATARALSVSAAVRDLHALVEALGQGPAVFWAQSFGAFVVRALAAAYPGDIESLILESPAMHEQGGAAFSARVTQRAVDAVITRCNARLACRLGVPSIRTTLAAWLATLGRAPIEAAWATIPYPSQRLSVAPDTLLTGLLFASYAPDTAPAIAGRLRQALGDTAVLAPLLRPVAALGKTSASHAPAYWSMRCSLAGLRTVAGRSKSAPILDITAYLGPADSSEACRDWPVANKPVLASFHAVSGRLVYGKQDIVTPPDLIETAIVESPALYGVAVAGGGHLPLRDSPCALADIADWLNDEVSARAGKLCSR